MQQDVLKDWRDRAEARLVRGLEWLVRVLPPERAVRFGERLGSVVGRVDRKRRRVGLANLELAFREELDARRRGAIIDGVYRHLGRFFLEYLALLQRSDLRPLARFVEFEEGAAGEGLAGARATIREHGAAIFVTLHLGHWELLGGAMSELVTPMHAVMKPLRNPYLNELIVERRKGFGMIPLAKREVVPALFRCLREGKSIGLLCDLNQKRGGVFADFFGVPAATVGTPALLALRTGKPIVCCAAWSTGEPLRYRARILAPLHGRRDAESAGEIERLTAAMNLQLESFVRGHPDQWNWIHPRWKTRPAAAAPGR